MPPRKEGARSTARLTAAIIKLLLNRPREYNAQSLAEELGETHTRVARVLREIGEEFQFGRYAGQTIELELESLK